MIVAIIGVSVLPLGAIHVICIAGVVIVEIVALIGGRIAVQALILRLRIEHVRRHALDVRQKLRLHRTRRHRTVRVTTGRVYEMRGFSAHSCRLNRQEVNIVHLMRWIGRLLLLLYAVNLYLIGAVVSVVVSEAVGVL